MVKGFVDFHCHPAMKPFGKSFNLETPGLNSKSRKDKHSIWFYDPPGLLEAAGQMLLGICKFSQADMCTLAYGNVSIICASLYPIEKGFFKNNLGTGTIPGDVLNNFVTGVGKRRVDHIEEIQNYFADLELEYKYYKEIHKVPVSTEDGTFTYIVVGSYSEIEKYLKSAGAPKNVIFVILTIEGLHSILTNADGPPNEVETLESVATIKAWDTPPFFITFSHHFYNHLAGHAKSLTGLVGDVTKQSDGMNTGFTDLGKKVLKALLNTEGGQRRIFIDIKHLSSAARKEYFEILENDYNGQHIPVIVSHGAANGLKSALEPSFVLKETAYKLLSEDINFYDEEIEVIARSGGLFCLQLDERRIANKTTLRNIKNSFRRNKIRHYRAELLWNQIQHIIEVLDSKELFAWDCIAIGSDFDGIINPLNGYLTAETFEHLQSYTERYAYNYMRDRGSKILKPYNRLDPSEIVNRIFSDNGLAFIEKWFF